MIVRFVIAPALNFLQRGIAASWLSVREAMLLARIRSMLTGDPFHYIDEFLQVWEYAVFAENRIIGLLSRLGPSFESRLARAWERDAERAASRAVYYMVIQAGRAIPCDSPLGLRLRGYFGPDLRFSDLDDQECFFSSDVFHAWVSLENKSSYELLDRWEQSEFAQNTILPLYRNMRKADESASTENQSDVM